MLRNGLKDSGCKFRLAYFRPASGLNEETRRLHAANLFAVVRQVRYSTKHENCLDLVLFLNGIPDLHRRAQEPAQRPGRRGRDSAVQDRSRPARTAPRLRPLPCALRDAPRPGLRHHPARRAEDALPAFSTRPAAARALRSPGSPTSWRRCTTYSTDVSLIRFAAFLNTEGGDLLIGLTDDSSAAGIEKDQLENDDKFMRHLAQVVRNGLGDRAGTCIDPKTQIVQGKTICVVSCQRSPEPVFLKWKGVETSPDGDFFVRSGPGTVSSHPTALVSTFALGSRGLHNQEDPMRHRKGPSDNSMQLPALRAAADAERWAAHMKRPGKHVDWEVGAVER